MIFKKLGPIWNSSKPDRWGRPYMSGVISEDFLLKKGDKIFVFQVGPERRGATSPVANLSVGRKDETDGFEPPPIPDSEPKSGGGGDDAPPMEGEEPF